jgi:hypothetical protein
MEEIIYIENTPKGNRMVYTKFIHPETKVDGWLMSGVANGGNNEIINLPISYHVPNVFIPDSEIESKGFEKIIKSF